MQNNFPERPNAENSVTPFGVLEMVIFDTAWQSKECLINLRRFTTYIRDYLGVLPKYVTRLRCSVAYVLPVAHNKYFLILLLLWNKCYIKLTTSARRGREMAADVMQVRAYREQANMSQEDLGNLMGVTRQTIAAWEKGDRAPSLEQLLKLARALNIPLDLLLTKTEESGSTLLFRADNPESLGPELRAVLSRKSQDYALVEKMTGELSALPPSHNLDGYDPLLSEAMGREIRDWLGVEQAPLGDVLSLLEEKGIKVILHALPNEVSGLSAYTEELGGVIFVNAKHPTERKYFTALHELGHLIFHRREYGKPQLGKDREKENTANHFAGAVLMPRNVVEKELRNYRKQWIPEPLLQDLKLRYQISMRTILIRANQVGIMPSSQKRQQYDTLDKKYGPTKEEPILPPPRTLRRLERLVYQALLKEEITTSRAAEILNKPLVEVHRELSNWLEEGD